MIKRLISQSQFFYLHLLHILNDGFNASLLLFLPFIAKDFHVNLTQVGLLGSLLYCVSVVLAIPSAYISAKFGGMKILIIALLLYSLGYIGISFASSYVLLFPMFLLAGIGFGVFHPIGFSLVAHSSSKSKRGAIMGNFTAIGEIGKVGISALVTLIIVYLGWHLTAALYGGIAFVIGIIFVVALRSNGSRFHMKETPLMAIKIRDLLKNKRFLFASFANCIDSFSNSSLFIFLPFLLLYRGADPALLGTFAAAYFIGTFAGKSVLGRLADKVGPTKVFIGSEILMALLVIIVAMTVSIPLIVLCSIVLGIFTKGTVPVVKTMIVESVEHHGNFQKAFGVNSLFSAVFAAVSPVLLGFISDTYTIVTAFIVMAVMTLFAIVPAILFQLAKPEVRSREAR